MTDFSWDDVYARRRVLAAQVQQKLKAGEFAFDVTEGFLRVSLAGQFLADQPMWFVPFYVIAYHMQCMTPSRKVIDHAWWLIQAPTGEPWGFVTEPYLPHEEARQVARFVSKHCARWGVKAYALPPEQSAWNPGSTVAIVTHAQWGYLTEFLIGGVGEALAKMGSV